MLTKAAAAFPTVTSVRVKDALEAINDVVGKLIGIRGAALIWAASSCWPARWRPGTAPASTTPWS